MGLKANFTKADVKRAILVRKQALRRALLSRFELVGWEFVKAAREKTADQGGFNDVTGNLRSSIGFAIVDHAVIVDENYEAANNGQSGGIDEAKSFIRELASNFEDGYALIVVAGMGYAAAVESRGKDVITGSSLEAEATLKAAINNLKSKV